ncbi:class A beta-lactamase [Geothrix fuzhouensis]|uniref:class A beta-lactamase n=1 Tax=Geothrix fuzhouensis TaxID=2966451 RepID=UPI0027D270CF|nr:class A beta-lactamase [Geothrix fuzhouensis]
MTWTVLAAACLLLPLQAAPPQVPWPAPSAPARLAALEARAGGRLGVAVLDTGSGRRLDHRGGERFPLCSTFKVLLAGAVLARVDGGQEALNRRVPYGQADLLDYAPVTTAHVAEGGLGVGDLCAAAVEVSDNTAANLLLQTLGGPEAITTFARTLGDPVTRLDRTEPTLNTALPGDPRDTTTPSAMVDTLRVLLLGDALSPASRQRLEGWMVACTTGRNRLRAGLPADWAAGDKTGSGERGTVNDVAILRPPHRAPLLVAVYYTGSTASMDHRNAVLAEVGRILVSVFKE